MGTRDIIRCGGSTRGANIRSLRILLAVAIFMILPKAAAPQRFINKSEATAHVIAAAPVNSDPPAPQIEPAQPIVEPERTPEPAVAPVPVQTCGPQSPQAVYELLLQAGLSRIAAIQQLGSWQQESGLDPCQNRGDNGLAWGLNSWHHNRRHDMPFDLARQVQWAIHVEMPRDCHSCYQQLLGAQEAWTARDAIHRSTRWGHLGNRWHYADNFSSAF